MLGKLYEALLEAGASPVKVREASEEIAAARGSPLDRIERDARMLIWMVALNIVLTSAILFDVLAT